MWQDLLQFMLDAGCDETAERWFVCFMLICHFLCCLHFCEKRKCETNLLSLSLSGREKQSLKSHSCQTCTRHKSAVSHITHIPYSHQTFHIIAPPLASS